MRRRCFLLCSQPEQEEAQGLNLTIRAQQHRNFYKGLPLYAISPSFPLTSQRNTQARNVIIHTFISSSQPRQLVRQRFLCGAAKTSAPEQHGNPTANSTY